MSDDRDSEISAELQRALNDLIDGGAPAEKVVDLAFAVAIANVTSFHGPAAATRSCLGAAAGLVAIVQAQEAQHAAPVH